MRLKLATTILIATIALATTGAAVTLAAHPFKSRAYAGHTAKEKLAVLFSVSKNGKTVKANIPVIPLYCQGGGPPETQVTKPATIHGDGSFSGIIAYKFEGKTSFRAEFTGKFVKRGLIKGTLASEFSPLAKGCSGMTTFTATGKVTG
ncbi:MAG TPA: hypothetical protein VGG08_04495 [Solirubrobacteraceae bacterium]